LVGILAVGENIANPIEAVIKDMLAVLAESPLAWTVLKLETPPTVKLEVMVVLALIIIFLLLLVISGNGLFVGAQEALTAFDAVRLKNSISLPRPSTREEDAALV